MDFLIGLWFLGSITAWFGIIAYMGLEPNHKYNPLKKYYKSWGAYRFYTLAIPVSLLVAPTWPFVVLYFWVVGLVKGK